MKNKYVVLLFGDGTVHHVALFRDIFSTKKKQALWKREALRLFKARSNLKKKSECYLYRLVFVQLDVYRRRQRKEDAILALATPSSTFGMHNLRLS